MLVSLSFFIHARLFLTQIELQDIDLEGYKMVLGWGKAVKISAAPFILPPNLRSAVAPVAPIVSTPFSAPGAAPHVSHVPHGLPPPSGGPPFPPGMSHAPPPFPPQGLPLPPMGHVGPPFPPIFPPSGPGPNSLLSHAAPPFAQPSFLPPPPQGLARPPMPHFAPPPVPGQSGHSGDTLSLPSGGYPQPPAPVVSVPVAEDLSSMSVDNFLDSIVASAQPVATAHSAPPVATSAMVPSMNASTLSPQQQPPPHALPAFRPPPPSSLSSSSSSGVPAAPAPSAVIAPPVFAPPSSSVPPPPAAAAPQPAATLPVDLTITLPEDPERQALIDLVAKYTASDGDAFEKVRKCMCLVLFVLVISGRISNE